ncbi:DUF3823 domain-containing protein [uncultured Chitinophaga sp.]|uniref:DUF3823 domain-containing protein n=1 Tax=uncultured Chitinophaga sp. TaxID=339340 RepID=UPI002635F406|nr:DUF3823 domain-containing protein [uncultured Chitinophaga sp.]
MQHFIIFLAIAAAGFAGCKKDNYQAPSSVLKGQVSYDKRPIGLRSNGVQLELWQPGFELSTKIPIYLAQEGTFSASVYDGKYKLVLLRGNGPWVNNSDTIDVNVNGTTEIDVPVTPYFMINGASLTQNGTTLTATFTLQQVNNSLPLDAVTLYVGTTTIVDQVNSVAAVSKPASEITDITAPITLSVSVPPSLIAKGYLYARIGAKTAGVAELIYTVPQKIATK